LTVKPVFHGVVHEGVEGPFIQRQFTRQGELLAKAGQTSALFTIGIDSVTRHLLHDCRLTPKLHQNTKRISKDQMSMHSCADFVYILDCFICKI
jgi:hypothetical protein